MSISLCLIVYGYSYALGKTYFIFPSRSDMIPLALTTPGFPLDSPLKKKMLVLCFIFQPWTSCLSK
jgi:hypothetical protein